MVEAPSSMAFMTCFSVAPRQTQTIIFSILVRLSLSEIIAVLFLLAMDLAHASV